MADTGNDSDISFESADEGEDVIQEPKPSQEEVSDNVKKKEEDVSGSKDGETLSGDPASENKDAGLEDVELGMSDRKETNTKDSEIHKDEEQQGICSDERTEGNSVTDSSGKEGAESLVQEVGTSETTAKDENSKNAKLEENLEGFAESPTNQSIDRASASSVLVDDESSSKETSSAGGGSWGSWGSSWSGWGTSLLSSASATVSAVSGSVGKVIENVESTLGVPKPEDLPCDQGESSDQKQDGQSEATDSQEEGHQASSPGAAVGSFFSYSASALTSAVGKTVTGGLDALESLGKKTMDVLQDGDPGLRRKRAYLRGNRRDQPNLSQLLREAKEEAEERSRLEVEEEERHKCHFGWLFEQNQGLAHLEALEILSNESETKVEATVGGGEDTSLEPLKTELMEIKDAFELEDVESEENDESGDFVNTITEHLFSLSIAATPNKLKKVQTDAHSWLANLEEESEEKEKPTAKEIHQKAMEVLADLTARSIEQFHKTGELLLLKQITEENKSPIQQATSLSKLTSVLCAEVSFVASKFSEKLSRIAASSPDAETVNGYITNIFLEASNSTSYIQDAFQLLLPVMQVVAIDKRDTSQ
ncbi:hypothetical protein HOLleu_30238 [Holothuria leucospilota]|uniref:Protein FAM114A2 n=1 Tax=Holothuria leucospilota TaxID=206669 RepID=A0A9Q1BKE6_HOLLE|nr:hypothetical protein HOLleu_30238 [Holothuria leucospilota]